jgi:signal transduction histidine kinase/ligand-binding sensor domain-containing protein/DNA-binding response OmpR family regulator
MEQKFNLYTHMYSANFKNNGNALFVFVHSVITKQSINFRWVFCVVCLIIQLTSIGSSLATDIKPGTQRIEMFANEEGFFQNTVNSITTDVNGFLWIATPNGLVRYDGYSFEYFYHDFENQESLPNNYIKCLLKDSQGRLWIGTRDGLCLYLADKELFLPFESQIKDPTFIKEDAYNRIWVGGGENLNVYSTTNNPDSLVQQTGVICLAGNLEQEMVVDIEFQSESELIISTQSKLYLITLNTSDGSFQSLTPLQFEYNGSQISKIIKNKNSLWVGTDKGIYQTLLENERLINVQEFLNDDNNPNEQIQVLSLFLDSDKNLWIGTELKGVLKYNRRSHDFTSFKFDPKNDEGLTSNRINCFYEDDFGVLWIGTAQGGLNKLDYNQKSFYNYSHNPYDEQSLSSNLITNIVEEKKGKIWLSFFDNTICRTTEKINLTDGKPIRFERLEKQFSALKKQSVTKLFQDERGYWWIGTNHNIFLYDESNDKLKLVKLEDKEGSFFSLSNRVISQINASQILIGGKELFVLDNPWDRILKDKPNVVDHKILQLQNENLINDYIRDGYGNYWVCTRDGIYRIRFDDEKWEVKNHITTSSGEDNLRLSYNNVFTIRSSINKDIWLGTFGGGLMKIQLNPLGEPEKIKSYHKKDGLPDEAIYGILEDDKGKFWISTDMGICRFDPINEKFEVYDINDGMVNNNFRQSSYLKTRSGIMLMGGLNGLTVFDPDKITKNEILPRVLLTRLKINDRSIVIGEKIHNKVILNRSISDIKKLVLSHVDRNISLDIVVQHTSAPQKNQLLYKLEGVNPDWIKVEGGKATATYTNLNAGTYKFFYKGANGDGISTKDTGELTIQVLAPWYLRWWSLLIWAVMVVVVIFIIFRYLVSLEKLKQKLKFEQLDKERVHEMDQAKLRFFTNISHEFKTPLSLIIGPFEKIEERYGKEGNHKYFSIIQNNISRLQRLVDQLISYRKAETGHLKLDYSKITLGNFIYPLLEAFEENAKRANINFYHKVYAPNRQIIVDIDKTERILLNLFSNAIKFTEPSGEISIEAGFQDGEKAEEFYVKISDTGIGISPEKIDRIFDRFYRAVDDRGNWGGTGIGLALCKSLADLMSGKISVESEQGKKTVFQINLPFDDSLKVESNDELSMPRKIVMDWIAPESEEISDQTDKSELPSLLIIDDEKDVRSFLQEAFKNNYRITLAVDGEEGLEKLNESQPQLIICDVMMPKLNGYQVCEKIKSNPKTCHIPVILLTALAEDAKKMEGLELGADDYITKPFSIKYLEMRVKKLIENKLRIIEYFSNSSKIPKEELNMSDRDQQFMKAVIHSIEKNMSDSSFGVEELAREVGMSTSHFYRRLKQLTGQVPNVYLRNFRLQKAAELLETNSDLNANEVMYNIGIESPSYFSTSFKKLHGVSPSEYMKKQNS